MELKEERNIDLLQSYDEVLKILGKKASFMSRESLVRLAISRPAKRHYVTVEEAAKHINDIEYRGVTKGRRKMVVEQYKAIHKNYRELLPNCEGMSKTDIINLAIQQPASSFYMELSSALVLFWKLSNGKKKKR